MTPSQAASCPRIWPLDDIFYFYNLPEFFLTISLFDKSIREGVGFVVETACLVVSAGRGEDRIIVV